MNIRNTLQDLTYVRNLRTENAALRQQLSAYQALIEPPRMGGNAEPIAARWHAVRWHAAIVQDGTYTVRAALYDENADTPIFELEEPRPDEVVAVQLAAQAPDDIRVLLEVLRAYERLQRVGRVLIEHWMNIRDQTPLDLDLAALAVQLRQEERTLLGQGLGQLFEDGGAA